MPEPPDLTLRARAAGLLVEGRGVVGGWAAAELLGAWCGPADAAVEVIVPGGTQRRHPGLRVRRGLVHPDEIVVAEGVWITTAERTAFDLACGLPLREGIVAVDALARVGEFAPEALFAIRTGPGEIVNRPYAVAARIRRELARAERDRDTAAPRNAAG
jgi:hypothetical protein